MSVAVPRSFSSNITFVYGSGSPLDWSVMVPEMLVAERRLSTMSRYSIIAMKLKSIGVLIVGFSVKKASLTIG